MIQPIDSQRARRLANAASKARQWRQERDALIIREHQAGAGLREIGRLTGLSHPAVKKITEKHPATAAATPGHQIPGQPRAPEHDPPQPSRDTIGTTAPPATSSRQGPAPKAQPDTTAGTLLH